MSTTGFESSQQHVRDDTRCAHPLLGATRRAVLGCVIACGLGLGVGSMIGMAPEPDAVPRRWELQLDPGALRVASVNVPDVGPRMFLYLTYRVTNNSGQDVFFAPAMDLSNGEGEVVRSGRGVPQTVTSEIIGLVQNPMVSDQVQIIGDILQGAEHAKDGVVIWPLIGTAPEEITIYATGFSGESKTVSAPNGKDKFVLRKTVRLEYTSPGSLSGERGAGLELRGRSWIMR